MKHLFIQQLEDIREVMLSKADHVLQMDTWFDDELNEGEPNTLDCGYAACVCGEMAVGGELDNFPLASGEGGSFFDRAAVLSEDLDDACADLTGEDYNATSLYSYDSELRKDYADETQLFTTKELDSLAHLNKKHPTAQDVADYLEVLIAKLVDKYGWGV